MSTFSKDNSSGSDGSSYTQSFFDRENTCGNEFSENVNDNFVKSCCSYKEVNDNSAKNISQDSQSDDEEKEDKLLNEEEAIEVPISEVTIPMTTNTGFDLTSGKTDSKLVHNDTEQKAAAMSPIELKCIVVRGCVIECTNIPSVIESDKLMVKVLYLHPTPPDCNVNPVFRCRSVIHETSALDNIKDGYSWKSSFLWNLRGETLERKIILHGFAGDLLFCINSIQKETGERNFICQTLVRLNQTGRNSQLYQLVLRDGVTPIGAVMKLETEVFLPKRLGPIFVSDGVASLGLQNTGNTVYSSSQRDSSRSLHSNSERKAAPQGFHPRSNDICEIVSENRKKSSQRRFEKRQLKLMRENANLQRRLREISVKPVRRANS